MVEAKDDTGWTPLIWASSEGQLTTVKVLVEECHANVEAKDNDGYTPLIHASQFGRLTTVKYLVEEGHANVEAKNNLGRTALTYAKINGYSDVEQYLRSQRGGVFGRLFGGGAGTLSPLAASLTARRKLSPAGRSKLDEELSDAADEGDAAKVPKLGKRGAYMEWKNPNNVSE